MRVEDCWPRGLVVRLGVFKWQIEQSRVDALILLLSAWSDLTELRARERGCSVTHGG